MADRRTCCVFYDKGSQTHTAAAARDGDSILCKSRRIDLARARLAEGKAAEKDRLFRDEVVDVDVDVGIDIIAATAGSSRPSPRGCDSHGSPSNAEASKASSFVSSPC